jgi:hypothetical protein
VLLQTHGRSAADNGYVIAHGSFETYSTLAPMFSNGRVILDQSRLEQAPRVSNSQLRNPSRHTWQKRAQQCWNIGGPRSR